MTASRVLSLSRMGPTASTAISARPLRLPSHIIRPFPSRPPPLLRRPFSHTARGARRRDPYNPRDAPEYDYDAKLSDPWAHHRLRSARPLFGGATPGQILRSPRTHTVFAVSVATALFFYWWNLEVVPVSGRKRFNCYSENTVRQLSEMQYKHLLYEMERQGGRFLSERDARVRQVKRVMRQLIPVAGEQNAEWEVRVIDNDDPRAANAFVLPGGKVFVYSGLMRLARTDSQLAAVLSHEIAHNLAKHISERLSQSVGEELFLGSLLMLAAATPFVFLAGWWFGGNLLDLLFSRPMGRMQESEADYIGLMMMAEACYDPREAVTFWERMDRVHQQLGTEPPEFLSTHPSNQHRIERITGWLPKAMAKRDTSDCRGTQAFAESFRQAMERNGVLSVRM